MRRVLVLVFWCALIAATPTATAAAEHPVVLVVGDSVSAAHGVAIEQGWVARLRKRIDAQPYPHRVVNASVSGDTTSGGRARLPALLDKHHPAVVVLELGGNDGLRGQPLAAMRTNLTAMIQDAREAGARVLLMGIRLPPNYGRSYIERFIDAYRQVARKTGVALVPRTLQDVGGHPALMQPDGIHPNADGHKRIVDTVWPELEPLLQATR